MDQRPLITILTGIFHLIMVYTAAILTQEKLYYWLVAPGVIEIAVIALPVYVLPKFLRWRETTSIGAFMRMMRDLVAQEAPNDDVRCAIFRPSLFRKRLIEAAICTSAGIERRQNKYMRISQGVAGIAYRTQKTSYIPIVGNWQEQMMRNLGFTEQEVRRFKPDRKSYLSIPILKRGRQQAVEVLAVASLDSNSDGTFTEKMITDIERVASYISDII